MLILDRESLFENDSTQGTLHLVIDDSKLDIKFYKSLKVEVSAEKELPQVAGGTTPFKSEECGDRSHSHHTHRKCYKKVSETKTEPSRKVFINVDGQFIPIIPLDRVFPATINIEGKKTKTPAAESESKSKSEASIEKATLPSTFSSKSKRRKIVESRKLNKRNVQSCESEGAGVQVDVSVCVSGDLCHKVDVKSEFADPSHDFGKTSRVSAYSDKNKVSTSAEGEVEHLKISTTCYKEGREKTDQRQQNVRYCKNCCKKFKTFQELKDHKKAKILTEFNCDQCSEVFPFKGFLEVHKKCLHGRAGVSVVHKDKRRWYSCDTCGALVKTLVKLQLHNLSHTGEGYFQCCLCPGKFGERSDLSRHWKTHCHYSSGMTRCRWCNDWFPSKGLLARHKLVCKEVRCHLCDLVFPNVTSRNVHYKDFHRHDILRCDICKHMFSSKEELEIHMENHSKFKKKQCTLCGLFFSRLKKHMMIHKNPSQLTEDEIFYCDKCPAKFTNKSTFSRHVFSHSGEKPYQCPNCPKTFANCGALYKHIKRHSTLLPYACEVCNQSCENIETLKSHMTTHSDLSHPFPCTLCTQSFLYRNSLESHMHMKHPEAFFTVTNATNATKVSVESFEAVCDMSNGGTAQGINTTTSTTTAFATSATDSNNTKDILEVVIPELSALSDANGDPPQFEIVIVEEKPGC